MSAPSTLLGSLTIVARHRGVHLSVAKLVRDHVLPPGEPTAEKLVDVAGRCGLRAAAATMTFHDLTRLGAALPAIVLLRSGNAMALLRAETGPRGSFVVLHDPNAGSDATLTLDETRFADAWTGQTILVKRDYRLRDRDQPFSLGAIVGLLLRDGRIVREIGIAAFLTSLLAISPIMFWRLLIDDVLYYQSQNTLLVLVLAMAVLIGFETAFGYLRRYLVLHITKRIDTTLSTEIFDKLLNLPVEFFERTPTGEIARDASETWKIRRFLTGQLFGTLLDGVVVLVILPILLFFSVLLTAVVLGVAALIFVWLLVMLPVLQRKAGKVFRAEGNNSSFLVESLHGIRTIKSLALSARRRHEWDVLVAQAAELRFDEGRTANLIQTVVLPLERLMTSGVFALAVYLAISTGNQVYVGALVAFMMLTMRLAAPLSQLATLLPEYDEARWAVKIIAKMINQPPEEGRARDAVHAPVMGRIEFSAVSFRYPGATAAALDDLSFTIPEGSVFGIMGRSGSGKTTVTRLLQMLHSSYSGLIKLDGTDLRAFDVDHLRASMGVVLQENFLFRGTVRDTIAAARPDAQFDDVIRAARLAGAEEFVECLPRGYDTWLQEGSTNLSGGQRQRLAIARALITDPRILILDEATSALDADSEAIVSANLMSIARNRTLLIISHRLSSLMAADAILVLERGRRYDVGRHEELLQRCDVYAMLWHQQNQHMTGRPNRSGHLRDVRAA